MSRDVLIVGAGGFGREVLDVIEAHNSALPDDRFNVIGVADDEPSDVNLARLIARGYRHLGTFAQVVATHPPAGYLVGIGSPAVKRRVATFFDGAGWLAEVATHPSAIVGSAGSLGGGTIVCGGVQLSTNVILGRHVHLNPGAIIGHDALIDDFVSVNPGAIVSGEVHVHEGTLVGAGAVILQGLTVGRGVIVGASACVTRDVESDATVTGVPARPASG